MRKESGFEVTDRIDLMVDCGETLARAIENGRDMIMRGVLALTLAAGPAGDTYTTREWDVNGQKAVIAIRRHN